MRRASSRDDDRGRSKTPTKGRGGRRGSAHGGYGNKRDTYAMDENSNEPMDIVGSHSSE